MMAALIFVISMVTLSMFFVSYCRSMMATAARQDLSEEVRDVTGIGKSAMPQDYVRVLQILALCPERPEDRLGIRAVGFYYSCLSVSKQLMGKIIPPLRPWADREQAGCAYFAAVALDRRISFNREMLLSQSD